ARAACAHFLVDVAIQADGMHMQPLQTAGRPQGRIKALGVGMDLELGGTPRDVTRNKGDIGQLGLGVARMARRGAAGQRSQRLGQPARFLCGAKNADGSRHCAFASACCRIFFHFSYSARVKRPKSSGEPPTGLAPSASSCSCRSGSAVFTPLLMVAITSAGVFFGAKKPNHDPASKPAKPDSATVGSSGSEGERALVLTASARNLPERICPMTDGAVANMKSSRPAIKSLIASAPL